MATWRINNATALGGEVCSPWQPNHAYSLGARCVCRVAYATTARRAFVYEATSIQGTGTSNATTEPTWPTSGTVVDAKDGSNSVTWTCRSPNDGTWDNASCCLWYVLSYAAVAAGDTIFLHNAHSEAINQGAPYQILKGSTTTVPIYIYSVDKADDTFSAGAIVRTAGGTGGIEFNGLGFSAGVQYQTPKPFKFPNGGPDCNWIFDGINGATVLVIDTNANVFGFDTNYQKTLTLKNLGINFSIVGTYINLRFGGLFLWEGGSVTAAAGLTKLFNVQEGPALGKATVRDVDLTAVGKAGTATSLVNVNAGTFDILFERCKIPNVANFTITSGTWPSPQSGKVRLHHCSAANVTYDFYEECFEGSIQDETTIVRTAGALHGATPWSWKMVSSANTIDNILALKSPPISGWTDSTTSKTFTIEGVYDSLTNLQDDEIWMEFEYPINNTDGLGGIANDKCAVMGTPADQASSTVAWTTTGITNINKFKLSVTVTPGKAGPITARVYLAKASQTVYIDPKIIES